MRNNGTLMSIHGDTGTVVSHEKGLSKGTAAIDIRPKTAALSTIRRQTGLICARLSLPMRRSNDSPDLSLAQRIRRSMRLDLD